MTTTKSKRLEQQSPTVDSVSDLAKRAGVIARNAHLVAINVREMNVNLLCEPNETKQPANLVTSHTVEHFFSPTSGNTPNKLRVRVRFLVLVKSEKKEENLFSLNAVLESDYFLPATMPEEAQQDFEAFSRSNALVHVWPYFRELVQSMTWRMGLPPFPLPLFRVTDDLKRHAIAEASKATKPSSKR